jgi:hypothetical protein
MQVLYLLYSMFIHGRVHVGEYFCRFLFGDISLANLNLFINEFKEFN